MSIHRQKEVVQRTFDGLPVIDAEADLRVFVRPEDIESASSKDFERCVIAQSCRNTFGSTRVAIMKETAYVQLADEDGNQRVERFTISQKARDLIRKFDRGAKVKAGSCFILRAPSESRRLDHLSEYGKKHREKKRQKDRERRDAKINGEIREPERVDKKTRTYTKDLLVRNGSGMVQMKRKQSRAT